MKLDQIAFYAEREEQKHEIKTMLGLQNASWVQDRVTLLSRFPSENEIVWHEGIAELNFCEALGPQVEIMHFLQGPHWNFTRDTVGKYFLGHLGLHVQGDHDFWPPMIGAVLVQESKTIAHTAPAFNDPGSPQFGRRYHYRIYQMPGGMELYLKLIKRINRHGA